MLILLSFTGNGYGQMLETKHLLSISSGLDHFKGKSDNIFFPSSNSLQALSWNFNYSRKALQWMSYGVDASYSSINDLVFISPLAQYQNSSENILSFGPLVTLHTPFYKMGYRNRILLGFMISPQYHFYSGNREIVINNEIQNLQGSAQYVPALVMEKKSNNLNIKFGPVFNYRITQRMGLQIAYNIQLLKIFSGYSNEQLIRQSLSGGFIFTFGYNKMPFY